MKGVCTMLALVKTQKGVGFLELREADPPKIGPDEVLIEVRQPGCVERISTCGTTGFRTGRP